MSNFNHINRFNEVPQTSYNQPDEPIEHMTKFAFLIHPLSKHSLSLLNLDQGASMLNGWNTGSFFDLIRQTHHAFKPQNTMNSHTINPSQTVRVVDAVHYHSKHSSAIGRLYEIPMSALEVLNNPDQALMYMEQATEAAVQEGAQIIGLGSLTAIVGNHGEYLAERSSIPVTTGNSLTVYAAIENMNKIIEEIGLHDRRLRITVVGIPGSIASAIALFLSNTDCILSVAARKPSVRSERLAKELNAVIHYNIAQAVQDADVVITATSSGGCIDSAWLKPGAIVLDVGVPTDVLPESQPRSDVLVLSAGYSRVPKSTPRTSRIIRFFHGVIPSCLAETITLALDRNFINFSIGKELNQDRIREIGASASRHGFDLAPLLSQGLEIEDSQITRIRKLIARQHTIRPGLSILNPSNDSQIENKDRDQHQLVQPKSIKNLVDPSDISSEFNRRFNVLNLFIKNTSILYSLNYLKSPISLKHSCVVTVSIFMIILVNGILILSRDLVR